MENKLDSVVTTIIEQFIERSERGKAKYGVDLDRTDLTLLEWIEHAKQEHMDAILYNHDFQKSVSYSQFSMWTSCPHKWYLTYVENKQPYQASIHTVFGTAMHETMQDYITVMYNESGANADRMNLEILFQDKFSEIYAKEYKAAGAHFTTPKEMGEFYEDAILILRFLKKNRNKLFTIRKVKLLGIEIPLLLNVANNVFLKGYIDFVLYDLIKFTYMISKLQPEGGMTPKKKTIVKLLKSYYTRSTFQNNLKSMLKKSKSNTSSLNENSTSNQSIVSPERNISNPPVGKISVNKP